MIAIFLEHPLIPLPRPVKPFPGETVSSYLGRLAHANHIDADALGRRISGTRQARVIPVERLAIVAGMPVLTLERAIADLDGAVPARSNSYDYSRSIDFHLETSGRACQLCAYARGASGPVTCWKPAEKLVCLRHLRWIGSDGQLQPSLDQQPEILKAHRLHLRLVRRYGREEVAAGFTAAVYICRKWHGWREHDEEFNQRLEIFHGPTWRLHQLDPTVEAAAYPQVVALARLLTSPYWKGLAFNSSPAGQARFAQELTRTVAPNCQWPPSPGSKDPLHQWLIGDGLSGTARRRIGPPSRSHEPWDG